MTVNLIITDGDIVCEKAGIFATVEVDDVENHETLQKIVVNLAQSFMRRKKRDAAAAGPRVVDLMPDV